MMGGNLIMAGGEDSGPAAEVIAEYAGPVKVPVNLQYVQSFTPKANFTMTSPINGAKPVLGTLGRYRKFRNLYASSPYSYMYPFDFFLVAEVTGLGIIPKNSYINQSSVQNQNHINNMFFDENDSKTPDQKYVLVRPELPEKVNDYEYYTANNTAVGKIYEYLKSMYENKRNQYGQVDKIYLVLDLSITTTQQVDVPGAKDIEPIVVSGLAFSRSGVRATIRQKTSDYTDSSWNNSKTLLYGSTLIPTYNRSTNSIKFEFQDMGANRTPSGAEHNNYIYSGMPLQTSILDYITLSNLKIIRVDLL